MGLSAPLRALSAGSTVRALRALAPSCERAIGRPLAIATDHGHDIHARARAGEDVADVVLLPSFMIADLIALGRLAPRAVDLGAVATSAVVCEGENAPDVGSIGALRAALAGASVVLLTTAPSGEHMQRVIERLGLADSVARKVIRFDRSVEINAWLADRRDPHALGFGPTTEIVGAPGVAHGGLIADEVQMVLSYGAGAMPSRAEDLAAQELLRFLTSGEARTAFAATGMTY